MPLPWFLSTEPPATLASCQVQKTVTKSMDGELQVTGKVQEIDPIRNIVTYSDGVAAKFGPTMLFADRLEIHQAENERYAIARGNVRIEDPEGELTATYVVFWYGPKKGPQGQIAVADQVQFELGGVSASAESAVIKLDQWEFLNVQATNCKRPLPLYRLKSKRVTIRPGRAGTLESPKISILGKPIATLPTRRFSLDKRDPGIQLPSIAYRQDSGLGVSWSGGFLLDDRSLILTSLSSFQGERPSLSATYVRSFLPAEVASNQIEARSEIAERFTSSYLDNIRVDSPFSSMKYASQPRNAITLKTDWNTGSSARLDKEVFGKLLDVAYERSGLSGKFGVFTQGRLQSIRRGDEEFVNRALLQGTVQAPPIAIAKGISSDLRLELFGVQSQNNSFGWIRTHTGVVFQPVPQLTAGAAWIAASEHGTPDFLADRLFSRNALHLRGDLNLGPTRISYLAKYDFNRKTWYDKEYSISQVVGCLEPYLLRREFPRTYTVGVRLRVDDFFAILERRKQVRTKPVPTQTISKLADKS